MGEEKKPTETEIIRAKVRRLLEIGLLAQTGHGFTLEEGKAYSVEIGEALRAIDEANEARDKSRTLRDVNLTVPLYAEEHYRSVLSIGFDLGVQAFRKELEQASCCSGQRIGDCGVGDPENPFREAPKPDH
ncbi:MAG TPA: hypothetical protein VER11_34625 [Polyangiaceae bacterium]|nr:hypothetical protein [Polyangiaceae bacterium]